MPASSTCFTYPPADGNRGAAPSAPAGLRMMHTGTACFRYQAEVPRSMPNMCFSYPPATPTRIGNRGAVPPGLPGLRQMPGTSTCFRY